MARVRDIFGTGNDIQTPINTVSVPSGGSITADVDVSGYSRLLAVARLFATATVGDLTFTAKPYDEDGTTIVNQELPQLGSVATAVDGADVIGSKSYDVRGVRKVRITVSNANVAAKNATVKTFGGS